MPMQMEEARGYVFQVLREGSVAYFGALVSAVGRAKATAERRPITGQALGVDGGKYLLSNEETNLILEVVWSLIVQGILIPGSSSGGQGWPLLTLTEYGQRCVNEDRILPHDPDGFLRDFGRDIPNADAIVLAYLTEALQCYIHGLHKSAAVMLGGASEQAVLLMIESYSNSIADPTAKQKFDTEIRKRQSIFKKYELFEQRFSGIKPRIPKELTDNADSELRGVFDLIRSSRNDAGHPAIGGLISRDAVYSHLRLFRPYYKRLHGLTEWFANNKT